jgi:hypothetical protein
VSCHAFRLAVSDLARGSVEPRLAQAMREHLFACRACRQLFEAERVLSQSLVALAQADEMFEPPPEVLREVLAAWERRSLRRTARSGLPAVAAAAFAIAAMAAWLIVRVQPGDLAPAGGAAPAVERDTSTVHRAADPARMVAEPHRAARPEAATHRTPLRASSRDRERARASDAEPVARDLVTFVPLWPEDDLSHGPLRLMRVRLSRASLAGFGLPMDETGPDGTLQADVLVGEDGVARAIRLVPSFD